VSLCRITCFIYCYAECHFAEYRYAEHCYAEHRYAEHRYAEHRYAVYRGASETPSDAPLIWVPVLSLNIRPG
jgi:hypothetical protein